MPISADTSPNIKWPLPAGVPAFKKENIFSEEMLNEIKRLLNKNANWGPNSDPATGAPQYHTIAGRWSIEINLPKSVWNHLQALSSESWGRTDLRLKNIWFARYQRHKGVTPYLWEHMDQPGTQYTMDICIEAPRLGSWGLIIDGEEFTEAENTGVLFMGQQQTHSRPPYPTEDPDAYIVLMFALFVGPEHWMYEIDAYDPKQDALLRELMDQYKLDGDIRYYEHTGHAPRFNDIPPENYPCTPNGCSQCDVVAENFVDDIPGYIKLR
jgi:hypothetical protein